jgi:hypothetical protein
VRRSKRDQGAATPFTITMTMPSVLLKDPKLSIKLPVTQIVSSNTVTCTMTIDGVAKALAGCNFTTVDANYNKIAPTGTTSFCATDCPKSTKIVLTLDNISNPLVSLSVI